MSYSGTHHPLRTAESWAKSFDAPWPVVSYDSKPLAPVVSPVSPTAGRYVASWVSGFVTFEDCTDGATFTTADDAGANGRAWRWFERRELLRQAVASA